MKKVYIFISVISLLSIFTLINLVDSESADYVVKTKIDSIGIADNDDGDFSTLQNFGNDEIKNVILILGDGVGLNHILCSRLMIYGTDGKMYCERLPITGQSNTAPDDDNYITDSGAGATALATGYKTGRKMIGVTKDSVSKTSIAELMKSNGYSVGLISTGQLADATPAAFSTKSLSRQLMKQIAFDITKSGFNILLGGSSKFYENDSTGKNAVDNAKQRGYEICKNGSELMISKSPKILALIDSMDQLDNVYNKSSIPSLAEVTSKSLELLSANKKGFFLMVEEDGTDEVSHNHNIKGVRTQMKQMDDAVRTAVEFARKDGKTLVIVTADHETGGLNIIKASKKEVKMIISWSTGDHTPQPVPVYSIGPYSYLFTGFYENSEIPRKIAQALKLKLD
jgi:alkaline phosphatase